MFMKIDVKPTSLKNLMPWCYMWKIILPPIAILEALWRRKKNHYNKTQIKFLIILLSPPPPPLFPPEPNFKKYVGLNSKNLNTIKTHNKSWNVKIFNSLNYITYFSI
jgi:hypothetical protein